MTIKTEYFNKLQRTHDICDTYYKDLEDPIESVAVTIACEDCPEELAALLGSMNDEELLQAATELREGVIEAYLRGQR